MKKVGAFSGILLIATLLAALYGVLHDQITYSLCPEYYTKFKFIQFGLADEDLAAQFSDPRRQVATVGFLATAWFGALLGLVLGLVALIFKDARTMFRMGGRSVKDFITVGSIHNCSYLGGLVGLLFGIVYLIWQRRTLRRPRRAGNR
jgi:hypothetical protein